MTPPERDAPRATDPAQGTPPGRSARTPGWRRWLPSREAVLANRWLAWLAPVLNEPLLWRVSRRGIAMGTALGIFFGLLIPIAQIPLSVAAAVVLRANVPAAVASTFVTNPVTFGPVYYAAWWLGSAILGEPPPATDAPAPPTAEAGEPPRSGLASVLDRLGSVGKPLWLGLSIFACAAGLLAYALVSGLWALRVRWQRRRRLRPGTPGVR